MVGALAERVLPPGSDPACEISKVGMVQARVPHTLKV